MQVASYSALLAIPIINRSLEWKWMKYVRKYVLTASYYLQQKITTAEPDRIHILTAIQSYRKLAEVEFPEQLREKKEEKQLAIVDVTVIPIGTNNPSVSDYVTEMQIVLERFKDKITYQLTPMSTIIEGELPVLFEVIQTIHEVPFQAGVKRVTTNIRIDDRRDVSRKMNEKVLTVEKKIAEKKENENEG